MKIKIVKSLSSKNSQILSASNYTVMQPIVQWISASSRRRLVFISVFISRDWCFFPQGYWDGLPLPTTPSTKIVCAGQLNKSKDVPPSVPIQMEAGMWPLMAMFNSCAIALKFNHWEYIRSLKLVHQSK